MSLKPSITLKKEPIRNGSLERCYSLITKKKIQGTVRNQEISTICTNQCVFTKGTLEKYSDWNLLCISSAFQGDL